VRIDLLPDAQNEVHAAARWYEERRPGLGHDLVAEVSAALARIAETPEAHPRWPGTETSGVLIRKAPVRRFPYLVAFEIHTDLLLVLAVAHAKRRPLYWIGRAGRSAD
jgi:hypothetical protein